MKKKKNTKGIGDLSTRPEFQENWADPQKEKPTTIIDTTGLYTNLDKGQPYTVEVPQTEKESGIFFIKDDSGEITHRIADVEDLKSNKNSNTAQPNTAITVEVPKERNYFAFKSQPEPEEETGEGDHYEDIIKAQEILIEMLLAEKETGIKRGGSIVDIKEIVLPLNGEKQKPKPEIFSKKKNYDFLTEKVNRLEAENETLKKAKCALLITDGNSLPVIFSAIEEEVVAKVVEVNDQLRGRIIELETQNRAISGHYEDLSLNLMHDRQIKGILSSTIESEHKKNNALRLKFKIIKAISILALGYIIARGIINFL